MTDHPRAMATDRSVVPPESLDPHVRERIRQRSKAMFGNLDRLDVAVAIALSEDGLVNATDLSWDLRIANNRVRAQLLALTELGLLRPEPGDRAGKRHYLRLENPFWQTCLNLYRDWIAEG
jgi:hypothetical protein